MKIREQHAPMLWILLPLICGIVAASHLNVSILIPAIALIISSLLLILRQKRAFIYPTIACLGYIITSLNLPSTPLSREFNTTLLLQTKGNNEVQLIAQQGPNGEWNEKRHKLYIYNTPDSLQYKRLICSGNILPLSPSNDYMRSLQRKGIWASFKITQVIAADTTRSEPLSSRMGGWAMKRLSKLHLSDESAALTSAMALARREGISKELRSAYNRSGTAHLLALSGLHLGVVVLIISSLCYLLPLLHNGHIWADLLAIIAIWLFAFMTGMSDSVMRAAWMFSFLQLASLTSRQYDSLNSLFAAAVAILCFDPLSLYDLSFRLSFVAVSAIILVGMPLLKLLRSNHFALDFAASSLIISLVATIATAPLISNSFGYIALLGPITTLPLLITMTTIIMMAIIWILCPLPFLAPIFSWVIEVAATIQNFAVRWFASWDHGIVEYRLSHGGLYILYSILMILAITTSRAMHHRLKELEAFTSVAKAKKQTFI